MFYFLSKLLQPLLWPFNINLIFLALALVALYTNKIRFAKIFSWIAFCALFLASLPIVSNALLERLETCHPVLASREAPVADVLIVLGGTATMLDGPRVEVEDYGGRLVPAVRLYREKKAQWVLVTSGVFYQTKSGKWRSEAQDMRDFLVEMGVPSSKILLEERARNTNENALYSKLILEDRKFTSALLVTSAFHMRRSIAMFKKHGFSNIYAFPTQAQHGEKPWDWSSIVPAFGALCLTTTSIKEYVGRWVYN